MQTNQRKPEDHIAVTKGCGRMLLAAFRQLAIAALLFAVQGCGRVRDGGESQAVAPIRIGVLAAANTSDGDGIIHGVAMAVDEINASGGVLGRRLEPVVVNTERSGAKVVSGYQRLAGHDRVTAVIGISSSDAFGVMPQLASYRVPLLATGAAADRLTAMVAEDYERYRYFFRVMHRSGELGDAVADYTAGLLHDSLGFRRFAILVEDDIWTRSIRESWERRIHSLPGAQVVYSGTFGIQTQDFVPLLNQILRARPDYILDATSMVDATSYLKQWAQLRGPPIGAIPTGAGTERYFQELGSRGIGVASVSTIPDSINRLTSRAPAWWGRYVARYGDPEYTSAYSYDAVYILKQALERTGGAGGDTLVAALERTRTDGVVGRWEFGRDHHPRYGAGFRRIPIIQYYRPTRDGYRVIWPADLATSGFTYPLWNRTLQGDPN